MITFSTPATAGPSPKQTAQKFFLALQEDISTAFDQLSAGSVIADTRTQEMDVLRTQTELYIETYGGMTGFELVHEKRFGESVVSLLFLLKCRERPLVCKFYFYKREEAWVVVKAQIEDDVDLLEVSERT